MSEELKPERPIAELQAGNDFRDSLISRADANVFGSAPLWHGWAIMDAFLAGIDYARRPSPPVVDGELDLLALKRARAVFSLSPTTDHALENALAAYLAVRSKSPRSEGDK